MKNDTPLRGQDTSLDYDPLVMVSWVRVRWLDVVPGRRVPGEVLLVVEPERDPVFIINIVQPQQTVPHRIRGPLGYHILPEEQRWVRKGRPHRWSDLPRRENSHLATKMTPL